MLSSAVELIVGARSVTKFVGNALLSLLALMAVAVSDLAMAQSILIVPKAPIRANPDEQGVDLASGALGISDPQISIGTADNGLSFVRYWSGGYWRHNYRLLATYESQFQNSQIFNSVSIQVGDTTYYFKRITVSASAPWISQETNGTTLTESSSGFTFTDRDGNSFFFDKSGITLSIDYWGPADALGTVITHTNGLKEYLTYSSIPGHRRLQSVRTSTGFQLKFTYASNTSASVSDWARMTKVQAINNAQDYCDPTADSCSTPNQPVRQVTYNLSGLGSGAWTETVTDPENRTRTYRGSGTLLLGIRRPSSTINGTDSVTYSYVQPGGTNAPIYVSSAAIVGIGTWNYSFTPGSGTMTASITTPTLPNARVVTSNSFLKPTSVSNENGYTTQYEYCPSGTPNCAPGLLTKVTHPEGNYETFTYDGRGNRTATVAHPKSGSGTITISSATYASDCSTPPNTPANCNKPATTTDSVGNVTNYHYNGNGTLDYVQAPSPDGTAPRPETHFTYWTGPGWLRWSSNSVSNAPDAVTQPTGTVICITSSWPCASSDQRVTEIEYIGSVPDGSGGMTPTNMLIGTTRTKRGDGSEVAATSYSYDAAGNVTSMTNPLGQTTVMSYAADRQLTGTRMPAPDGSPTAQRMGLVAHYDSDGLPDSRTIGTVNWDGSNFTGVQYSFPEYDVGGRLSTERVTDAAGAIYSRRQWSYNGAGRLECETTRVNSVDFASPPAPCVQGTGAKDRIAHYQYEDAGAVAVVQTGYPGSATGNQRNEVAYSRNLNGQITTMIDARNNVTSYAYDGYYRQLRECYNAAVVACQDGTALDFVQVTYDGYGRLVNRSLRGHAPSITIGYGYDNLGRLKFVDYPGPSMFDSDVTYTYDNLGRMVRADDANTHSDYFEYDALGRVTQQGDSLSARTMQYYANGLRKRLTWADGRYITYQYNAVGAMTDIFENGSVSLAHFDYDLIGRRTSLARGNGVTTYYGYDGASRLNCLTFNLAGGGTFACSPSGVTASGSDQAINFLRNGAGQITTRTAANDIYSWSGTYNVNRPYLVNGLNQYTASGAVAPSYDVKGNLASAGGTADYTYSTKNELVGRSDTGVGFYHDPLGRLDSVLGAPGGDYGFQYDGAQISTEVSATSGFPILRRYVYGPDDDEPIVWYEGGDFSNKRYLVADERGSVVAVTDTSGAASAINTYDEYGIPGAANTGRFQYTGQAWLSELGMYSYKARIYSPTLGRFLQTDPAGYPDGPNWYNYINADPVNNIDPSGTLAASNDIVVPGLARFDLSFLSQSMPTFRIPGLDAASPPPIENNQQNNVRRQDSRKLRRAWQEANGKPWPKDPSTGRNQDVSHKTPLADGGDNSVGNIEPKLRSEHVEMHSANGDFVRWGARGVRSFGIFGLISDITGILSGRIRTDSLDNFASDISGIPSDSDIQQMNIDRCGAPICA